MGIVDSRVDEVRQRRIAGELVRTMQLVDEILADPEQLSVEDQVLAARQAFLAASTLQDYPLAGYYAEKGLQAARQSAQPDLIAAATYHAGCALINQGDWAEAQESLETFLRIDAQPDTDHYRAPALFNLGLVFIAQRQYREAVNQFRQAEVAFAGDRPNVARCLLEAAWAELLSGRAEAAGLYLERATEALDEDPDPDVQTTLLCHRAFYHYQVKEYEQAASLCREVSMPDRLGVTAYHKSEAAWIAGECLLALGERRQAAELAEVACAEALKAAVPWLMNRADDLRRRINEAESA